MAASLNQIFDRLGNLTAKLDDVARRLDEQDERSASSRANMHRRLDEVVLRTTHLESDVSTVTATVQSMKATTDKVEQWEQRGMGALAVIGIAGAAIGGAAVYFFEELLQLIRGG